MKHTLLILGSLYELVDLTKKAKARGYRVLVADGYRDGPAKVLADKSLDCDVRDTETIAAFCRQEGVDGIITSFSDLLFESMVKIAHASQIPTYLLPDQLPWYRDKYKMKSLLATLGIKSPKHTLLSPSFSDQDLADIPFPAVTKPLNLYGSRGIYVVKSPEEIRKVYRQTLSLSGQEQILLEEYHTGYEFNLMSWVHKGKITVLGIADREKSPGEEGGIPVSTRNVYPSRLIDQVYDPALAVLEKWIRASGQKEGALSMQFFWTPGQDIEVCEIAGRLLGYEHELIELSGGISIENLLLDSVYDQTQLEETLQSYNPFMPGKSSAVLYFQGKPGKVTNMKTLEEVSSWPQIHTSQLFYKSGVVIPSQGAQPYVGRYYITADSREEIDRQTKEIFDKINAKDLSGDSFLYPNMIASYPS